MFDYENKRLAIVKGLKEYLKHSVIRQNQNKEPPAYPFTSYTITTLMSENKGTYGEYDDGSVRKPFTQTWSITTQSNNSTESVINAIKAREWFDRVGTTYLNDNGVIVQSVGSVTNRDNILTVEYEYRNGFDVVFWFFDSVDNSTGNDESIESFEPKINLIGGGGDGNS